MNEFVPNSRRPRLCSLPKFFPRHCRDKKKNLDVRTEISGIRVLPRIALSRPSYISNSHLFYLSATPWHRYMLPLFGILYLFSYVKFMTRRRSPPLPLEFPRRMRRVCDKSLARNTRRMHFVSRREQVVGACENSAELFA